ncbi:ATP synthase F1 subunit delta [Candidatus Annandia pinicola]|uniref:ATP synthase F1 subunit delta n=1 Tax=Candidatus Annandia pinicola TaxID=1345117 RepID=UPI001D02E6F4|nr:ATP synthase F1 subunit delta [Candidatus Annandia pinicola]UDG80507.1 ATP synthase subunit delta [Candidatus Annandia pinicola]
MNIKIIKIIRIYTKAIFEFSVENNKINYWYYMLHITSKVICNIYKNIKSLNYINLKKIYKIIEKTFIKNKLNFFYINFIKILIKNERLTLIPKIFKEFKKLRYKYYKINKIKLITINKDYKNKIKLIKNKIKIKYYNKVIFKYNLKNNMIAGIIIVINNKILDYSILNKINCIEKCLKF